MSSNGNWCMDVDGRIYGPYSGDQMRSFVEQKRLAYHSLVAPAGSRDFRPALQFSELKPLFSGSASPAAPSSVSAGHAESSDNASHALLVIFENDRVAQAGAGVLADLDAVMNLSGSAALVRGPVSAEALRDRLSRVVPNTERVLVFPASPAAAACHGVSLDEHERIARLIAGTGSPRA